MVATPITLTTINRTGIAQPTGVASDNVNHNSIANDGTVFLLLNNTGGSTATVTVAISETVDGITVPARSYSVAAAAITWAGPFPTSVYGRSLDVLPSASTVHIAAVKMPRS